MKTLNIGKYFFIFFSFVYIYSIIFIPLLFDYSSIIIIIQIVNIYSSRIYISHSLLLLLLLLLLLIWMHFNPYKLLAASNIKMDQQK